MPEWDAEHEEDDEPVPSTHAVLERLIKYAMEMDRPIRRIDYKTRSNTRSEDSATSLETVDSWFDEQIIIEFE